MAQRPLPGYEPRAGLPQGGGASGGGISTGIVIQPVQAPTSPAQNTQETGAAGRAMAAMGAELVRAGERVKDAHGQIDEASATTEFYKRADALEQQHLKDPDFRNAPDKFDTAMRELQQEVLGKIADPHRRERSETRFTSASLVASRRVRGTALYHEVDDYNAGLGDLAEKEAKAAAGAETPIERQAARQRYVTSVEAGAEAMLITRQSARQRVKQFDIAVDLADVERDITADPVGAQTKLLDQTSYPNLDIPARARYTRQAQNAIAARDGAVYDTVEREGFKHLRDGTLSKDWLDANADHLGSSAYRRFSGALTARPAAPPDPVTYAGLLDKLYVDPRTAMQEATTALRGGKIDRTLYSRLHGMMEIAQADAKDRPWANGVRQEILRSARPGVLQDRGSAMQQLNAVTGFEKWLTDNPDAGADEAREAGFSIAAASLGAAAKTERVALPMPKYSNLKRDDMSLDHLDTLGRQLVNARDKGLVSPVEFNAEIRILARWTELFGREVVEKK